MSGQPNRRKKDIKAKKSKIRLTFAANAAAKPCITSEAFGPIKWSPRTRPDGLRSVTAFA